MSPAGVPAPRRVLLAWSSGKDSAWSLHVLRARADVQVVGLLTTLDAAREHVPMHAVRRTLLEAQAAAVGLPLWVVELPWPCTNDVYAAALAPTWARAVAAGITDVAFGDLFLEDVRRYREHQLRDSGLGTLFPLWGRPTRALAEELIEAHVVARLTCVDTRALPAEWAGRAFDRSLLDALPASVDACGERGEFHTFVSDGPMFRQPVPVRVGARAAQAGFAFVDLLPATHDAAEARARVVAS